MFMPTDKGHCQLSSEKLLFTMNCDECGTVIVQSAETKGEWIALFYTGYLHSLPSRGSGTITNEGMERKKIGKWREGLQIAIFWPVMAVALMSSQ